MNARAYDPADARGVSTAGPLFDRPASVPFVQRSTTSIEAAASIRDAIPAGRLDVLRFVANRVEAGSTDEEIADGLRMNPSSVRPRRVELVGAKLLKRGLGTRKTRSGRAASVWIVTDDGVAALREAARKGVPHAARA
jgi:hypothetical protein